MASSFRRCRAFSILAAALALGAILRAEDAKVPYGIPPEPASDALRQFQRQSGSEIVLVSGSLDGIRSAGVIGRFTASEALGILTQGTPLTVAQDPQTGAFAIGRRPQTPTSIIKLPPYIVAGPASHLHWKYTALPGYEVLSCCSERETEDFLNRIWVEQSWLDEIVPPRLQCRDTVPTTLILFNDEVVNGVSAEVAALAQASDGRVRARLSDSGARDADDIAEYASQVKLWDEDSTAVDIVPKHEASSQYGNVQFEPEYVYFLLKRRVPPLPEWLVGPVVALSQMRSRQMRRVRVGGGIPLFSGPAGSRGNGGTTEDTYLVDENTALFTPVVWVAPQVSRALADHPSLSRAMIPLETLLTESPPPAATLAAKDAWLERMGSGKLLPNPSSKQIRLILDHACDAGSPWRRDVWNSETQLFVRWALDSDSDDRRMALWKLAAFASVAPVTNQIFEQYFGMTFAEADRQIGDYLGHAILKPLLLARSSDSSVPWIEMNDPTEGQKARILGDWSRMECEFVKPSHPAIAKIYARHAARIFSDAYQDGVRDPDFLAAYGIFAATMGDDAHAGELLAMAVDGATSRPRAYVELSRIRLARALAAPRVPGGRLDAGQMASVLDPLMSSWDLQPPQNAAYHQAAEAWEHAAQHPSPVDLRIVQRGCLYFPADAGLAAAYRRLQNLNTNGNANTNSNMNMNTNTNSNRSR